MATSTRTLTEVKLVFINIYSRATQIATQTANNLLFQDHTKIIRMAIFMLETLKTLKPSRDDFNVLYENGKHDRCI